MNARSRKPAYEDGQVHWGSLGLGRPVPKDFPVHCPGTAEQHYEEAYTAVLGGRAQWVGAKPTADGFWSDELVHLEAMLPHATPARQAAINRRINGVLAMILARA